MSDVFISYSKEDGERARLISDKLGAAGFTVWWDRHIMPGKTWDEVIGASLDSAACVVVLWSKVSVLSRWVREEAERGAGRQVLVPIFIDKVDPPFGFGRIEGADLSAWQGEATDPEFANLCEAIAAFVKHPPAPKPVAQPMATPMPTKSAAAAVAPAPVPPAYTYALTPQFFLGRWQVNALNGGSDVTYFPDGTFNGIQVQNIAGYNNPMNVFGRWNMQAVGPALFQLQLWYANMTTWGGTFRVLDVDHIQSLEWNYIASRVR